jgi:hypothetical protein
MIDLFKKSLLGQFGATLSVLDQCAQQCPEDRWGGPVGNHAFWHVAYHALFFADLYLSPDEASFEPPSFYREDYHFFGRKPWPPYETVVADVPYPKDTILEYVELCRAKASRSIARETPESLEGPCGFWWYKVPRAEFYLINIRHIQHHAAQMNLYLRNSAGIGIDWVPTG